MNGKVKPMAIENRDRDEVRTHTLSLPVLDQGRNATVPFVKLEYCDGVKRNCQLVGKSMRKAVPGLFRAAESNLLQTNI